MKVLIQRSLNSRVSVQDKIVGEISSGMVVLVGFTEGDTDSDIRKIADKIVHLRIFDDQEGIMNCSLLETGGAILSISQFTLYADCQKGRRPSYQKALPSLQAEPLYQLFNQCLKESGVKVETGIFGADMQVSIQNNGPVTIILESREFL